MSCGNVIADIYHSQNDVFLQKRLIDIIDEDDFEAKLESLRTA